MKKRIDKGTAVCCGRNVTINNLKSSGCVAAESPELLAKISINPECDFYVTDVVADVMHSDIKIVCRISK